MYPYLNPEMPSVPFFIGFVPGQMILLQIVVVGANIQIVLVVQTIYASNVGYRIYRKPQFHWCRYGGDILFAETWRVGKPGVGKLFVAGNC